MLWLQFSSFLKMEILNGLAVHLQADVYERIRRDGRPVVMYGTGNGAEKALCQLAARGIAVQDFFASDSFVRGQSFLGRRVLTFSEICRRYRDFIIVLGFGSDRAEVLERFATLDAQYTVYAPDLPIAGETVFDRAFYTKTYYQHTQARARLADAPSRALFDDIIAYRLSGSIRTLLRAPTGHWSEDPRLPEQITSFADFGAYHGDTIQKLLTRYPDAQIVFAMEPDPRSFAKLQKYCQTLGCKVKLACAAAWSEQGEVSFACGGGRSAAVVQPGITVSHVSTVTSSAALSPDCFCAGAKISLLKYDVEGAEYAALCGSIETIRRCRPVLVVSAYHRPQDLFVLPELIASMGVAYRYYLQRDRSVPAWDIQYLCIPEEADI